jgi:hypothetical protein
MRAIRKEPYSALFWFQSSSLFVARMAASHNREQGSLLQ